MERICQVALGVANSPIRQRRSSSYRAYQRKNIEHSRFNSISFFFYWKEWNEAQEFMKSLTRNEFLAVKSHTRKQEKSDKRFFDRLLVFEP